MDAAPHAPLLSSFPLLRSRSADEASERIGRIFSPHRLALRNPFDPLDVRHNQIRLREVSINVLQYGADVLIDPGERGDFYMVQLPLAGRASIVSAGTEVGVDCGVLSVLQPQTRSRMTWSGDCSMILLQVPRSTVRQRSIEWGMGADPRFALARSRRDPEVGAWWQAVLDLTCNLDRYGRQWLSHPAAYAAMEEFLLSAFTALLREPGDEGLPERGDERCLQRAKEFIHAHPHRALSLAEIARHACVSPRTLEAAFKRHGEASPLAYARRFRLRAVHDELCAARRDGRPLNVTDVALSYGFVHMGRFAAQYRQQFGCSPSVTLRPH
ncbi:MAG: AraC family transcriptional regulator [Burkholderiaceae bacterium]